MNKTYAIADLHLGHKNICKYQPVERPFADIEEHDREVIERCNSAVRKNDTLFILGDVCFGSASFEKLKALNGIKRLIMGNHDNYPISRYAEIFNSIHGVKEYKGGILTHIPVHESQFERYRFNIHGHLHADALEDKRYINVCCERVNCTPVLLEELINTLK